MNMLMKKKKIQCILGIKACKASEVSQSTENTQGSLFFSENLILQTLAQSQISKCFLTSYQEPTNFPSFPDTSGSQLVVHVW